MAAGGGAGGGDVMLRPPPPGTFGTGGVPATAALGYEDAPPVVRFGTRTALWTWTDKLWAASKRKTVAMHNYWYAQLRDATHEGAKPSLRLHADADGAGGAEDFDLGVEAGVVNLLTFYNKDVEATGRMVSYDDVVTVYSMTASKITGRFLKPHNNYLVWGEGLRDTRAAVQKHAETNGSGSYCEYHFKVRAATNEGGKWQLDITKQDPITAGSAVVLEVLGVPGAGGLTSFFVAETDDYLYISKTLTVECLFLVEAADLSKTMRFRRRDVSGDQPTLGDLYEGLPDVVLENQRYYGRRLGSGEWNAAGREEFGSKEWHFMDTTGAKVELPPTDERLAPLAQYFRAHHMCDGDGPFVLDWRLIDAHIADDEGWMYAKDFPTMLNHLGPIVQRADAGASMDGEVSGVEFDKKNKKIRVRRWVRKDSPEGRKVLGIAEPEPPKPPTPEPEPEPDLPRRRFTRAGRASFADAKRSPAVKSSPKSSRGSGGSDDDSVSPSARGGAGGEVDGEDKEPEFCASANRIVVTDGDLPYAVGPDIWSCPVLARLPAEGAPAAPDGAGDWGDVGVVATMHIDVEHGEVRVTAASHVDELSRALQLEASERGWEFEDPHAQDGEAAAGGAPPSGAVVETLVLPLSSLRRVEPVNARLTPEALAAAKAARARAKAERKEEEDEDSSSDEDSDDDEPEFPDFRRWIVLRADGASFRDHANNDLGGSPAVLYIRPDDTWEEEDSDARFRLLGKPEDLRTHYDVALSRMMDAAFLFADDEARKELLAVAHRNVLAARDGYARLALAQAPAAEGAVGDAMKKMKEANANHRLALQVEEYFKKIQTMLNEMVTSKAKWGEDFEAQVRDLCENVIKEQNDTLDRQLHEGQAILEETTKQLNDSLMRLADLVRSQMLLTLQFASPVIPAGQRIGDVLNKKQTGWMYKSPMKALGNVATGALKQSGMANPATSLLMAAYTKGGDDDDGEAAGGAGGDAKEGAGEAKPDEVAVAVKGAGRTGGGAGDDSDDDFTNTGIPAEFPSLKPPFDMNGHLENHRCIMGCVTVLCCVNLILVFILALVPV